MTRPLCVDLDGCLVRSDLLVESFLLLVGRRILYLFLAPFWLLSGKARLKAELAQRAVPDPQTLPYHEPFLNWLRSERDGGRELWLCTASNHRIAEAVANHLGLFTEVRQLGALFGLERFLRLIESSTYGARRRISVVARGSM